MYKGYSPERYLTLASRSRAGVRAGAAVRMDSSIAAAWGSVGWAWAGVSAGCRGKIVTLDTHKDTLTSPRCGLFHCTSVGAYSTRHWAIHSRNCGL